MEIEKIIGSLEAQGASHDKLQHAIEQNADCVMITDVNGVIEYVNDAMLKTTGFKASELIGKTPSIFKSGRHDEEYYKQMWLTIIAGKPHRGLMVNKKRNNELFYIDETISPIKDENGEITHFVSVSKEKTEFSGGEEGLELLMQTLKIEREKLKMVLNMERELNTIRNVNKLIDYVVEETASILEVDRCSLMFLDKNTEQLCVKGHYGLDEDVIGCARVEFKKPVVGIVAELGEPVIVDDIETDPRFKRENRTSYRSKSFMSYPIKLDNELMGVINVSEKREEAGARFSELDTKIMSMIVCQVAATIGLSKLYRELNYYNTIDHVTNLFNYQHFTRTLEYELTRAKSFSGCLALLRIDVNNFRQYRQDFGDKKANELLKLVGEAIKTNLRDVDIACRYAGDEFIVILPEAGTETAKHIAQKIRKHINDLEYHRKITVCMGIARYRDRMDRFDLISKVNTALNNARKEGVDQIYY